MKEIKKINKFSLAKLVGLIYGLIGFFVALAITALTVYNMISQPNFSGSVATLILFYFGVGLLLAVLTSIMMSIFGWICGLILGAIYNWLSKKIGGIKIELIDINE